jgi:hypothetical protein
MERMYGQVVDHATQVLLLNNLVMFGFQNLYVMIGKVEPLQG